jgi:WD40 repeat protein/serine/threonine protein kinase/tetratricopeptide (TPR) repeat protein
VTPPLQLPEAAATLASITVARADAGAASEPAGGERPTIPGYEILGELGRGGMGVVYSARQVSLNRLVALKMILAGGHAGREHLARFRMEAETVARLQHPHIVQIHEVGQHEGRPYLALELVEGESLDRTLRGTPQPPRPAAKLVETLAQAVHVAHQRGIVHRDLKPGNILLVSGGMVSGEWSARARSGDPAPADGIRQHSPLTTHHSPLTKLPLTPKITDFGLAKQLDSDAAQTRTGAILGTPSYMAPEQAQGKAKAVGPAADVYALGAILYELLTGRPPFKAATVLDTLEQVRSQEPVAPGRLQPRLPRDLETICLKCLEKDPHKRYATAQALAVDLKHFLADEPIAARPVSRAERLRRWCRRNPVVASLSAVLLALLLVGAVAASLAVVRIAAARDDADQKAAEAVEARRLAEDTAGREKVARGESEIAKKLAERKALESREQLVRSYVGNGVRLLDDGDLLGSLPWFAEALRNDQGNHQREEVHRMRLSAVLRRCPRLVLVASHQESVMHVEFSPDSRRVLTVSKDQTAQVWDLATGRSLLPPTELGKHVQQAAFSPDGRLLLAVSRDQRGEDSEVQVRDAATGAAITAPFKHRGEVKYAAFSPDGRQVLTATEWGVVQTWDIATGKANPSPVKHNGRVDYIVISRDGRRVVIAGWIETRVYDVASGKPLTPALTQEGWLNGVSFDPEGRLIAVCFGQTARVWEVGTGRPLTPPLAHDHQVTQALFSPDGKRVVTVSDDRTARVWAVGTGKPLTPHLIHGKEVWHAAFSPDGRWLATASADQTARLWDAATGRPVTPPLRHGSAVTQAVFSPDGRLLVSASWDQTARVWDLVPVGPARPVPLKHGSQVITAAFHPKDVRVVTAGADGMARVWDEASGEQVLPPLKHRQARVECATFSPDGRHILTASVEPEDNDKPFGAQRTAQVRLWDAKTGELVYPPISFKGPVTHALFSPDGKQFATAGDDHTVRVFDRATGKPAGHPLPQEGGIKSLAFSPDGRRLLIASWDQGDYARVWDIATGQPVTERMRHGAVIGHVAFSPDGHRLLTTSTDQTARLWDAATGRPLLPPLRHTGWVTQGVFSPRGDRVVTAGVDGIARIWDVATGEPATPALPHSAAVTHVGFSADGRWLVSTSEDGVVRLWDASTGEPLAPPLRQRVFGKAGAFRPEGSLVTIGRRKEIGRAWFTADRRRLLTAGWDDTARVWEIVADARDTAGLVERAQLLAGARIHATGGLVPLPADTLQNACENQRAKFPKDFATCRKDVLAWHLGVVAEAEAADDWFAVRWHLDRLLDAEPGNHTWYKQRAQANLELDAFDQAIADSTKAISLKADDAEAWLYRGLAHVQLRAWNKALADLSRAIELDGGQWRSWFYRGLVHGERREWEMAIADYSRAIALNGDYWKIPFRRGAAHAELGHWVQAVADFAKSSELERRNDQSLCRQALAQLGAGDLGGYRKTCTALMNRFGQTDDGDTANSVAWTCALVPATVDDPAQLVRLAEKALASDPRQYNYLNTLAAVLCRTGKYEAAVERFGEAIKAHAKGGTAWDWLLLAIAHHHLGHTAEARQWLDKATAWIDGESRPKAEGDKSTPLAWNDRLELQLLRSEAEGLIRAKPR